MDEYRVSAVITTYNRKRLVERAIRSVLKQSLPPFEIIVIDDGSEDGTEKFIREKFPTVKYVLQNNSGISRARNRGISIASGDWIAFLDSDDEWLSKKNEVQVNALKKNPDFKICYTNEIWIRNEKRVNQRKIHAKYGGYIFEKCLPLCIISPSSVVIKKDVFREYGTFDSDLPVCEDYDLWLRLCAFLPVLYIDEPLIIKYGGHEDQLSKKYWGMDRFRIYALEKIVNNKNLDIDKRCAAASMMIRKIDIYLEGAKKRDKHEEVQFYEKKREKYLSWGLYQKYFSHRKVR